MQHILYEISLIFSVTMVRYFIMAGIAFLVVYKFFPGHLVRSKIQARSAKNKDFFREIKHSAFSCLWLSLTAFIALSAPLRPYTLIYTDINAYPLWGLPVSLGLSLVIHDTYFYWMHRFLHHERLFRHSHVVHHLSTNPSPWSSYSFHFFEAILEGAVVMVLAFVLPMHPSIIVAFTFVSFMINVYGHLGYEIMPKGLRKSFLFEIINTSTYHNFHHRKFKGNYSLYFRHWDRLMKTEHPDYVQEYDRIQEQRFGSRSGQEKKQEHAIEERKPLKNVF